MFFTTKKAYLTCLAFAALMGGCAADTNDLASDDAADVGGQSEALKLSENGLKSVNGLKTTNGLKTANGLKSTNGLKTVNGLTTINGLKTANGLKTVNGLGSVNGLKTVNGLKAVNGLKTVNGLTVAADGVTAVNEAADLPVDCGATGVPGVDCWGYPDGMLNPVTGMMASDNGIQTASYLIRCALPATETVGVVDYTGKVQRLKGEVGLAPEFSTGDCGTACQENVSACLMAFTNGKGVHVPLVMSSTKNALGGGKDSAYPFQEGAFFGNLFSDPPKAFFCKGQGQQNIATMWYSWNANNFLARMCPDGKSGPDCPYVDAGDCTGMAWSPQACSKASDGTMTSCKGGGTTWQYPITTYLKSAPTTY